MTDSVKDARRQADFDEAFSRAPLSSITLSSSIGLSLLMSIPCEMQISYLLNNMHLSFCNVYEPAGGLLMLESVLSFGSSPEFIKLFFKLL